MNKNWLNLLLIVITLVIATACSTARKLIKEPLKEQGTDFLVNNLKKNELNYEYFSAKFSAKYKQDKKETAIAGQLRIRRDSAIWISVSPIMGIEMIRLLITNDSIWYVNRIDNTYFTGAFDYIDLLKNSTLDFDMLQSFLTGNDFTRYESTSFKGGVDNSEYTLQTTERRKLKKYLKSNQDVNIPIQHLWLNPETFKITRILIREIAQNGKKAEARYTHQNINGQLVPVIVNFEAETGKEKATVHVEYSKINLSQPLQFPFRIPEKYSRIEKL
ncbi:MAG TPA: DUF4292 domain-containing protein [Lentimicrobium sp.]|nr:DUF4292 domain-containing protein [Lentimicrobium sp.]